jgi:hypothetical protein
MKTNPLKAYVEPHPFIEFKTPRRYKPGQGPPYQGSRENDAPPFT